MRVSTYKTQITEDWGYLGISPPGKVPSSRRENENKREDVPELIMTQKMDGVEEGDEKG